jgi:hypothetical protein
MPEHPVLTLVQRHGGDDGFFAIVGGSVDGLQQIIEVGHGIESRSSWKSL